MYFILKTHLLMNKTRSFSQFFKQDSLKQILHLRESKTVGTISMIDISPCKND